MRKRILSTLTSGTSGIFAPRFAKLAKFAKLARFAKPAKFALTLLAAPLATLLCGALFGGHSAYALEAPTITLSISSALVTNDNSTLVPTAASGNSSHYYIPVTIETTNADTYSVNISSSSANLTAAGTSFVIAPANSEGQTLANLTNQWGFRSKVFSTQPADPDAEFGSTVYKPVTTAGQSIVADEPANASQVLMLDFGAGVTSAADSGKYTATVTLAAVATPKTVVTFQEFTLEQCNGLSAGETVSLADSRDGKTYRVTKMSDGNCWMTQNLAISPSGNAITTWNYSAKTTGTVSSVPASVDTFSSSADGVKNWHQGSHVDATNSNLTGAAIDNQSTNTGNYYSWYLAIGQDAGSGSSGEVTTSICPAGWRLPSTDMYNALAKAYNASNSPTSWDATILGKGSTFGTTTFGTHFGITSANSLPGAYSPSFDYAGASGSYWASTILNASSARRFSLDSGVGVNAQNGNYKYYGYSIRCVFDMPTFQNFSASDYSDVATGESFALKDARDGKQYLVAKLEDGNYWMVQNLAIEGGTTLTSATSDVSSNYTLPSSSTSGFSSDTTQYMYNGSHTDGTADSSTNTGGYYSFLTATANTGTGSSGDTTSSICPKGWKLPTTTQYNTLATSYGGTGGSSWDASLIGTSGTFGQTTFGTHFGVTSASALVGYYYDSSLNNSGSRGHYWSSSIYSSTDGYVFYLNSSNGVYAQNHDSKRRGYSVRCVYDATPTFQDFSASDYSSLASGETITLKDSRDGKKYLVTKMADGNVWMIQNLAIEGGTTLTSADSDVSSNYTLPASDQTASGRWNNNSTAYVFNGTHQDATYDTAVTSNNTTTANTGGYYSFVAATAGTGTGSSGEASSSICPKGWKLPTKAQYDTLKTKLGTGSTFNSSVFKPAFTGSCDSSNCPGAGSNAYYWSSTIYNSDYAYRLYTDSGGTSTSRNNKYGGRSVRCIFGS